MNERETFEAALQLFVTLRDTGEYQDECEMLAHSLMHRVGVCPGELDEDDEMPPMPVVTH